MKGCRRRRRKNSDRVIPVNNGMEDMCE